MQTEKEVHVLDVEYEAAKFLTLAKLGRPYDEEARISLIKGGLRDQLHLALWCLGWIWHQWLLRACHETIREKVSMFVERGLTLRKLARDYEKLPHNDLALLNCAILGSKWEQVLEVAEVMADSAGDKGFKPIDIGGYAVATGELYAAAWCGLMKYTILGNEEKAREEYELIWRAMRDPGFTAAPKALTAAWVNKNWKAFINQQNKDFDRLWARARKHSWSVKSETERDIFVQTLGYQIGSDWCWSHCSLAILAHRAGVKVATDPFWFPPHALKQIAERV